MDQIPALVTMECAGPSSNIMHADFRSFCKTWTMDHRLHEGRANPAHAPQETARRGTCIPQDGDDHSMECRWVRQAIHEELDSMRKGRADAGESCPTDVEVARGEEFLE